MNNIMKRALYPSQSQWAALLTRPAVDDAVLKDRVFPLLEAVRERGDDAVREFTEQFDKVSLESFVVTEQEITEAADLVPDELKTAIGQAAANIRLFHSQQLSEPVVVETMPGVRCWRRSVAIEKVGLYIPGGSAPLFSTILMLALPAKIAGCRQLVLCSPPGKDGKLHPAILYAAKLAGVSMICKIGGVQAIGAMAYGTQTVPRVDKIFGPGNQYVTCAKQLIQRAGVAIDMPAGPSEVCVLADDLGNPAFIAADLLSQAEHGPDSQVLLVTTDASLPDRVEAEIAAQLEELPRKETASAALRNSRVIVMKDMGAALALVNEYAPEHLIIACKNDEAIADGVINAGSVFLGHYSPESAGDYASGTNHTLPTNGYARAYSGVSVDSFVKKITYQKLTQEGLANIADTVTVMAEAEGLAAHARAVYVRTR